MFKKQLGRNMEAYIDNMVVKSKAVGEHLFNLMKHLRLFRNII